MDAIERAIRSALERGDADDRAFREKVYRSVFGALERSIASSPELSADVAQRRRETLKARITQIEQEFQPALGPVAPAPPSYPSDVLPSVVPYVPSVDPAIRGRPYEEDVKTPVVESSPGRIVEPEPQFRSEAAFPDLAARSEAPASGAESGDFEVAADDRAYGVDRTGERRRPWTASLIAAMVLAALIAGGWWLVGNGLLGGSDSAVPGPPVATEGEDLEPKPATPAQPATAGAERGWTTVFSPADPVSVSAPANARADIMEEEGQTFIRIRSGEAGQPIVFDVGQGILERIAGRRAVFDVVARAEEGQETQISIQCDFGGLGDCGRRRYLVGTHRSDCLFDVELPAGRPSGPGTISIVSDVDQTGKAIDIFEIRVSIAD